MKNFRLSISKELIPNNDIKSWKRKFQEIFNFLIFLRIFFFENYDFDNNNLGK